MPDNGRETQRWWRLRPLRISITAQQEADRRTGELLISLLDQPGKAEVDALLANGNVVHSVRRVRELTGLRLLDAKRLVDSLRIARPGELDNSDS
jgi:ribosomal protein L7/L12